MRRLTRVPFLLAAVLAIHLAGDAAAQDPGWFRPSAAWREHQARTGVPLEARWDEARGVPRLIFGSAIPLGVDTIDERAVDLAARGIVDELEPVLGVCSEALELAEIRHLRLSRIGSSDKVAALYRQVIDGVPVHRGTLAVLFSAEGELLAVDSTTLPHAEFAARRPEVPLELALEISASDFAARTGLASTKELFDPGLVLYPARAESGLTRAELAWMVHVAGETDPEAAPVARGYAVAATGAARILDSWTTVHDAAFQPQSPGHSVGPAGPHQQEIAERCSDLTARGWGLPGLLPEGYDTLQLFPLEDLRVMDILGNDYGFTDEAGRCALPIGAPTQVSASMDGRYALVWDWWAGQPGQIPGVFGTATPGQPLLLDMNEPATEQHTANVNVHRGIQRFRDWIVEVDPTETIFDFPVWAQVNGGGGACYAKFDGASIRFARAIFYCPNMAFSTIIWHEEGHWANELFGSGNGPDGFGEGAADTWSMYVADDAIVGRYVIGGVHGRSGWNTRRFCGDAYRGCYGEVHDDGEVLMGALWKVRARLQSELGAGPGRDVANALFLAWFQAFDDGEISTLVLEHWLVLDDDDGNPANGTPHGEAIRCGFTAQGFPTGLVEVAGLLPSQPATVLLSGSAIDLDGDRLAVGAGGNSNMPAIAGVAHVYVHDAAGWIEEARIVPSDSAGCDGFGRTIDLDGDTLVVGAPWRDEGAEEEAGAAYVFVRQGSSWIEQAKLTATPPAEDDAFASGVSLRGDRLIVGAPGRDDAGSGAGAVYVYERSGSTWSLTAQLAPPSGGGLGYSVSLDDDRLVAGAPSEKVHVFAFDGAAWSVEATLESGGPTQELFGFSVSLSGDTLAVGAPSLATGTGSVYVYDRSTGSWLLEANVTPPGGEATDFFGYDLELDTHGLVVGAPLADDGADNAGEAYLFVRLGSGWELRRLLRPEAPQAATDNFGTGVTLSGPWIAASAPGCDEAGDGTGKTHVFGPDNPYQLYGVGTDGLDDITPVLWACGEACPGGTVKYHVHAGVPGGTGDLYVGSTRDSTPFYGGTMLVGNITSTIPVTLDSLGSTTVMVNIPTDPLLVGTSVNVQFWGVDFAAYGDHSASNGLEYVIQP